MLSCEAKLVGYAKLASVRLVYYNSNNLRDCELVLSYTYLGY